MDPERNESSFVKSVMSLNEQVSCKKSQTREKSNSEDRLNKTTEIGFKFIGNACVSEEQKKSLIEFILKDSKEAQIYLNPIE